jgi:hypothetical protein
VVGFGCKSESFALALKKRTGSLWLPVWRNLVTGALRLEAFLHLGELEFCFGQGFHYESLCVFGRQIASRGHFTDQEILGAL